MALKDIETFVIVILENRRRSSTSLPATLQSARRVAGGARGAFSRDDGMDAVLAGVTTPAKRHKATRSMKSDATIFPLLLGRLEGSRNVSFGIAHRWLALEVRCRCTIKWCPRTAAIGSMC
jgi:hypothetical protein